MSNLFCPIERARAFEGKNWAECESLGNCPYEEKEVHRKVEGIFSWSGADDHTWPRVAPTCDETWVLQDIDPTDHACGDEDRVAAEIDHHGNTRAFFTGNEDPIFLKEEESTTTIEHTKSGQRVFVQGRHLVWKTDVRKEVWLSGETRQPLGWVFIPVKELVVSWWRHEPRPDGKDRCGLYKRTSKFSVTLGKPMIHTKWGVVMANVDPDGVKATVLMTGGVFKRVLMSHLLPR